MIIKSFTEMGERFTDKYFVDGFVSRQLEANNIRREFPLGLSSMSEADFSHSAGENRKDLRAERCLTIDCADTQDMDDAVGITRIDGGYLLHVHIADVASYVSFGGNVDAEAALRGSSVYLPDRTIPMLPPILTDHLCSIEPNADRRAVTIEILLDEEGDVVDFDVFKSMIRSRVKGYYAEVNDVLDGAAPAEANAKYLELADELFVLDELATKLNRKRIECGAEVGNRDSPTISFCDGAIEIECQEAGRAESLIEECMVLANTLVADYFASHGLPLVLRSQPRKGGMAGYSHDGQGHVSLALSRYAHFTSPIRRLADLRMHQILSDFLDGASAAELRGRYGSKLEETCELATRGLRRARCIQRACDKYCYCRYLDRHRGEEYSGEVVGHDSRGRCLVLLDKIGIRAIAGNLGQLRVGTRLAFQIAVNWKSNTLYTRNARALAA